MFVIGFELLIIGIVPIMALPFMPAAELIFSAVAFMNHIITSGPSGGLPWVLIHASPKTSHVFASAGLSLVISRSSSLVLGWLGFVISTGCNDVCGEYRTLAAARPRAIYSL